MLYSSPTTSYLMSLPPSSLNRAVLVTSRQLSYERIITLFDDVRERTLPFALSRHDEAGRCRASHQAGEFILPFEVKGVNTLVRL